MKILERDYIINNKNEQQELYLSKFYHNLITTINDLLGTWTNLEVFVQSAFARQQMEVLPSK